MEFTPVFWKTFKIWKNGLRYTISKGGTRSSKTYSNLQLLHLTAKTDKVATINSVVAITVPRLMLGAIRDFENILRTDDAGGVWNKGTHTYTYPNGSILEFFSADSDKAHGPQRNRLFVNECQFFGWEVIRHLITRTSGQILLDYNPTRKIWIEEKIIDNEANKGRYDIVTSTYLDNTFLSEEQIKDIEANKIDEAWWQVYGLGITGSIRSGYEFYSHFGSQNILQIERPLDPTLSVHVSFDFNVSPYICAGVFQIAKTTDGWEAYMVKEFTLKNPYNQTRHLAQTILNYLADFKGQVFIYGDASGKHADTRGEMNDWDIIEQILRPKLSNSSMRVPVSNPRLKGRREFMNKILADKFAIKFRINTSCKVAIEDFQNVLEAPDGTKLKQRVKDEESGMKYEPYGHVSDFCDYFFCEAFRDYFDR